MGTGLGHTSELKRQRLDNTSQRAVLAWCRHEDGAARGDVGDDFFAVIGGVKKAGWMDLQYKKLLLSSKKIRNKSI